MTTIPEIPFVLADHCLDRSTVVIEASAGTGKTFSLTALVIRLLLEGIVGGTQPTLDRILLVTFTNKATDELRTRLRARVTLACALWGAEVPDEELLQQAKDDGFLLPYYLGRSADRTTDLARLRAAEAVLDQAPISTIHSFCLRVLGECAALIGLPPDITVADDEADRLSAACRDAWRSVISTEPDAATVRLLLEKDEDDDAGGPVLAFTDLERQFSAWAGADRPFLPVDGDAPDFQPQWPSLDAERRLGDTRNAWQAARNGGTPAQQRAAARRLLLQAIDGHLASSCQQDGVLTQDALLQHLRAALRDETRGCRLREALQQRFPAALIDEFQDTDPVQAAIFTTAFQGGLLRCIGDRKQSIYRFRGADLHAYLDFVKSTAQRVERMGENFRSAPGCVAVVNHLFRQEREPFLQDGVTFVDSTANRKTGKLCDGEAAHVVWWWLVEDTKPKAERCLIRAVAGELRRMMDDTATLVTRDGSRPFRPKDAAVLTATNQQASLVAAALRAAGIAAVNRSMESVCVSEAARELTTVLAAIAAPDDGGLARTAICTRLWGGTQDLLLGPAENLGKDLAALRELARWWRNLGVLGVVGRILRTTSARARLLAEAGGERYLTDLWHVAERAHGAGDRPAAVLAWLTRQRTASATGDEARLRLEDDGDAVAVMTVHAAKGLEWPVVFAPFLWCTPRKKEMLVSLSTEKVGSGRPVAYQVGGHWVWDWRPEIDPVHAAVSDHDARAEAVRQVYVALTRASERTYIAWGPIGKKGKHVARSGLGLIAGPTATGDADKRAFQQAKATADWLWPEIADPATVEAARILTTLPNGANKQQLITAGVDENAWKTVSQQLRSLGLAKLEGRTYISTGKPLDTLPVPPNADIFAHLLGQANLLGRSVVVAPPAAPARRPDTSAWSLIAPDSAGAVQAAWSITSFTGLTKGAAEEAIFGALGDEETCGKEPMTAAGIHAFPAGAGPGDCLHRIIELADLRQPGGAANQLLVQRLLRGDSIAVDQTRVVLGLLEALATTSIPGTHTTLAGISAAHLRHEWPFDLAIAAPTGIRGLADAFRTHTDDLLDAAWADRVESLSRHDVTGFLTGRADMVASIDGAWWVIDWKSNRLGTDASVYTTDALRADAVRHRYPLQWMIYLVALHRHLSTCLPDYQPAKHLGGAGYCYLRGLQAAEPGAGWLVHRPSVALITALDRALGNHRSESGT